GAAFGNAQGMSGGALGGVGFAVFQRDELQAVPFDDGAAGGAADIDADGQAVEGGGGGDECAERAGLERERGDGNVFDLDIFMGGGGGFGVDAGDGAGEPLQQIDGMDGLVHQSAAAVHGPGAAPLAAVVVLLGAPPFHLGGGEDDLAELAGV